METEPQGAIVTLDGDEKGVAPALMENVIEETMSYLFLCRDFFRRTQKINVDAGFRVNAAFKLAIDQSSSFAKEPDDKTKSASSSANDKQ